jgi:tetratricopeptide (TPR) repeat protein
MMRRAWILVALWSAVSSARPLGRIDFPVSAPEAARRHFLRGMLAMHSFWYEEARDEFRAATRESPDFAMGYWGEALTYYHPVWSQESPVASRQAMAKIPANARVSDRERGFLDAARLLFGEGERVPRLSAYAAAMGKLHEKFPDDDEVATLYSVALLGANPRGGRFRPYSEAAAISLAVMAHNPDHPGAAHYVIHAFDDPEHAVLALAAARRYAQIAPEAFHALHMPSHIFVQLGMWDEAQKSNEASFTASVKAAEKKHLDASYADFHSLSWLMWISFERGQRRRATEVLEIGRAALQRSRDPDRLPNMIGQMGAEYLQITGDWSRLDELLAPLKDAEKAVLGSATQASTPGCAGHVEKSAAEAGLYAEALDAFTRGEAAFARKDAAALDAFRKKLDAAQAKMEKEPAEGWHIGQLELAARADELRGKNPEAALRQAVALEEKEPPSGPAGSVTARERLGELLLAQGKFADALAEFRKSLELHPRRSRSLLGAARAAERAHDAGAADYFRALAANWAHADTDTPGLAEVRAR